MFYERPAVASKPQGPRGPWSGPDRATNMMQLTQQRDTVFWTCVHITRSASICIPRSRTYDDAKTAVYSRSSASRWGVGVNVDLSCTTNLPFCRRLSCSLLRPADGNTRSHGNLHVLAPIRAVCQISTRPGHISRLGGFHEGPCFQSCVELFLRTQTDPLHPSICHMPGSPVTCCVFSIVSTRLRQRSTHRFACPRTEQTSVRPECWRAAHLLGKHVRSRFIATTWPSLVAGCGRRNESTIRLLFSM